MKKLICALSIILIIFSVLAPVSKADGDNSISKDMVDKWMNEGTGGLPGKGDTDRKQIALETGGNNQSSIINAFLNIFVLPPKFFNWLMSKIVLNGEDNYVVDGKGYSIYTIQDMLLNQYYLFDIDFFDLKTPYKEGDPNEELINTIKQNVSIWYNTLRNLSLVGMALIIIYVAIRIVLEITKNDNGPAAIAKYKKMLMSWGIGFLILLILPYLVKALLYVSDLFTNIITGLIKRNDMEAKIIVNVEDDFMSHGGAAKIQFIVIYYVMVFYEAKFFLMYLKRSFETFFLMIIAPLVCMLYPIDKIGDGRSQSFSVWLDKLMSNIFLRPIQLLIYVIFIATASELATKQPIIAILFFMALSNGEKIIKLILGFGGPNLADQKLPKPKMAKHKF